jgi:hypothetical protein
MTMTWPGLMFVTPFECSTSCHLCRIFTGRMHYMSPIWRENQWFGSQYQLLSLTTSHKYQTKMCLPQLSCIGRPASERLEQEEQLTMSPNHVLTECQ